MPMKWGDRLRIAIISFIVSLWLFIIDGINYIINFNDADADHWARYLIIVLGILFGLSGMFASMMIFCWAQPRLAGYIICGAVLICGSLRLLCVIIGFDDFAEESHLNSTTNSTTDIAIACFQFYMLLEGIHLVRKGEAMGEEVGYAPVQQRPGSHYNEEA